MVKKIAILMATYNGQKYVDKQVESILGQKLGGNYQIDLYIHDDGSKDGTLNTINQWMEKEARVHIIPSNSKTHGVKAAIFALLSFVSADYYYFADQDDIWAADKLLVMQRAFMGNLENVPIGIYSDLLLVDEKNVTLNQTMMEKNHWSVDEARNLSFLFLNPRVTGAAFAINRSVREMLVQIELADFINISMHDAFIALLTVECGDLIFINEPLVRYRQHGNNQIGASKTLVQKLNFKKQVLALKKRLGDIVILYSYLSIKTSHDVSKELKETYNFVADDSVLGRVDKLTKSHFLWKNGSKIKLILITFFKLSNEWVK